MQTKMDYGFNVKQFIRIPVLFGFAGVFLLTIGSTALQALSIWGFNDFFLEFLSRLLELVGWVFVFAGIGTLINQYLKYGLPIDRIQSIKTADFEISKATESPHYNEELTTRIDSLEQQIGELDISKVQNIQPKDEEKILQQIEERFTTISSNELLERLLNKSAEVSLKKKLERLSDYYQQCINRLAEGLEEVGRRGNINLIIGILATIAGFSIFWFMVVGQTTSIENTKDLLSNFAPRLSLVLLIEVFAYFFLGLYKSSLSEVKYFQNEIINIEVKLLSLEQSLMLGDVDNTKEILLKLTDTERNFILKKGESTVQLETGRTDNETNKSILQQLSKIINNSKE